MKKLLCILTFILSILSCFSQDNLVDGFIVTVKNDTVFGKLKEKNYSTSRSVKLYNDKKTKSYSVEKIKNMNVNGDLYVTSENGIWTKYFFKKTVSGSVNLYNSGKKIYLGAYDNDINIENLNSSLKFYCNDYPNFDDSIKHINKSNAICFIGSYNNWKMNHSDSKSYFEKNRNKKNFLNYKVSFFQPGLGLELGLSENFTINSMLKFEVGWNNVGFNINPIIDTQFRYYHNVNQRKINNIRTYKYSANYISLVHIYELNKTANIVGLEYGWQRTFGKNKFLSVGVGLGKGIESQNLYILYDLDFGFNF